MHGVMIAIEHNYMLDRKMFQFMVRNRPVFVQTGTIGKQVLHTFYYILIETSFILKLLNKNIFLKFWAHLAN